MTTATGLVERLQHYLAEKTLVRYSGSALISLVGHLVVLAGFFVFANLSKTEALEIREINFVDLAAEQEKVKFTPFAMREKDGPKKVSKQGNSERLAREPQNRRAGVIDRPITGQPKRSLPDFEPPPSISLAQMSAAAGIHRPFPNREAGRKKLLAVSSSAIQLDRIPRSRSPRNQGSGWLDRKAETDPASVLLKSKAIPELEAPDKPDAVAESTGKKELASSSAGSRVTITGPLNSRVINRKYIPVFPLWAKRRGLGATISLRLTVRPNGSVKENIAIIRTSGSKDWDKSVVSAMAAWQFAPLAKHSARKDQTGTITFHFVID